MKYWLLVLGIFISAAANAQFGFYANAGANYSQLHIKSGVGHQNGNGGFGWQAGGGVEYHTQFGYFLYGGLNLTEESFSKDSTADGFQSVVSKYSYKPLFLNFPFGIAYQFDLTEKVGLKVYGGMTIQVGVAGKFNRHTVYYIQDSVTGSPIQVREDNDEHNIKYGRNSNKEVTFDLANSNVGLNIGAGLNFSKSAEISLIYQYGLKNILPGGEGAGEVNKLGLLQLDLKLYFPKQYYSSKQKR